jgi:hypothetical protein
MPQSPAMNDANARPDVSAEGVLGARIFIAVSLQNRAHPRGTDSAATPTLSYGCSEDHALAFAYRSAEERRPHEQGWDAPRVGVHDISANAPSLLLYLLEAYGLTLNERGAICQESGEIVAELRAGRCDSSGASSVHPQSMTSESNGGAR